MKSISGKAFTLILKHKGWQLKRIKGSHYIFSHPQRIENISVPVHKNDTLKIGLLKKLLSITGIKESEL